MNSNVEPLLYGASWCEKTSALKEFLELHSVKYTYFDVDEDPEAETKIRKLQDGNLQIPVVMIRNAVLRNPSIAFLDQKLTENGLLDPI